MEHYQDFFRWRSENVAGYHGLYERFAKAMDSAAVQAGHPRFVDCNETVQRGLLDRCLRTGNAAGDLARIRVGLFERQALVFDRHLIREIFDLFARTDAWIKLGYETWPGEHRGLYSYTQPPELTDRPDRDKAPPTEDLP